MDVNINIVIIILYSEISNDKFMEKLIRIQMKFGSVLTRHIIIKMRNNSKQSAMSRT